MSNTNEVKPLTFIRHPADSIHDERLTHRERHRTASDAWAFHHRGPPVTAEQMCGGMFAVPKAQEESET